MTYAKLLRVWKGFGRIGRCARCKGRVLWVIDDMGKHRPFQETAKPLREEPRDERGRVYEIYEPTSFHRCPRKGTRTRAATATSPAPPREPE